MLTCFLGSTVFGISKFLESISGVRWSTILLDISDVLALPQLDNSALSSGHVLTEYIHQRDSRSAKDRGKSESDERLKSTFICLCHRMVRAFISCILGAPSCETSLLLTVPGLNRPILVYHPLSPSFGQGLATSHLSLTVFSGRAIRICLLFGSVNPLVVGLDD